MREEGGRRERWVGRERERGVGGREKGGRKDKRRERECGNGGVRERERKRGRVRGGGEWGRDRGKEGER
jgi:hypothetical protein